MARARYEEKKLDEHRSRAGRTVQSPIVLSDEGDEDEDDTGRLSELIALVEVGLQAKEAEEDTDRLSELIALAEAGLQAEETEDDTGRLSELIALADCVRTSSVSEYCLYRRFGFPLATSASCQTHRAIGPTST